MSKHAADTASTTKKFLAAGGLAFGVASLGLFASAGTATADGHEVQNPDGTFGATDEDSPSQRLSYDQEYGVDTVPARFSYDTSANVLGANTPVSGSPAGETHFKFPLARGDLRTEAPAIIDEDGFQTYDTSSYPADPSWPDNAWGVDEHG
jgi:hypothetical protein